MIANVIEKMLIQIKVILMFDVIIFYSEEFNKNHFYLHGSIME